MQRPTGHIRRAKRSERGLFDSNARDATGISAKDVGTFTKMSDSDNSNTNYLNFLCSGGRISVSSSPKQLKSRKSYFFKGYIEL